MRTHEIHKICILLVGPVGSPVTGVVVEETDGGAAVGTLVDIDGEGGSYSVPPGLGSSVVEGVGVGIGVVVGAVVGVPVAVAELYVDIGVEVLMDDADTIFHECLLCTYFFSHEKKISHKK